MGNRKKVGTAGSEGEIDVLKARIQQLGKERDESLAQMSESKQMHEDLVWESELNKCLADLSEELLTTTSVKYMSVLVLQYAQQLIGSSFGFVGHIDPQTGHLVIPTFTSEVWGQCRVADKQVVFDKFAGLWGWPLKNKKPILTNDAAVDPRACGLPEGHIPVRRFLAVPALCGGKVVGQIALADPDRDFTLKDQDFVERLASIYALIIQKSETEKSLQERVADLRKTQKALEKERGFLQTVIDGIPDPIMVIGPDHRLLLMNQATEAHLPPVGKNRPEYCFELLHRADKPCEGPEKVCLLEKVRTSGQAVTTIGDCVLGDGTQQTCELQASPLRNEKGEVLGIIKASRDITYRLKVEHQLRVNREHLQYLSHHDPLTDLPNRLLFREHLTKSMAIARRAGNKVVVMLLDLDRFKNINESLGHQVGDEVLRTIADRLRSMIRASDTVARLEGDQFGIIMNPTNDLNNVPVVAKRLLSILPRPIQVGAHEITIAGSLGASVFPADAEEEEKLIMFAEAAMHRTRENGGNDFQFYTPDMNARTQEFLLMETTLRKALKENQFLLHFQPLIDLATGGLVGVEALIRWNHPNHGMVSPADFIPLAEETGLIIPIGEWVLETACRQAKLWQAQGLPPLRMAVNISGRQFRKNDFVDKVASIIQESGWDPRLLDLEITESMVMENVDKAITTLKKFRTMGISLSIDDFGTGYSSLSYLKKFPIQTLKIDRSFIRGVIQDPKDSAIASSIIALAHNMGLKVVGEGIETEEQLRFLKENGCNIGQGYLFSRPMPAREITRKIRLWGESNEIMIATASGAGGN